MYSIHSAILIFISRRTLAWEGDYEMMPVRACCYCATMTYHVGLNANLGGHRTPANNQEKWTFGFGRVRGLVCTIAVSFGN